MPQQNSISRFAPILIATFATVVLYAILFWCFDGHDAMFWSHLDLAKAASDKEYCEYNRMEEFLRQPMNAISNFCYFFLGIWIVVWSMMDLRSGAFTNPTLRFPAMNLFSGLMQIGLCFGSFFFHASLTKAGQHWDMTFTYGLCLSLILSASYRVGIGLGLTESHRGKTIWILVAVALVVLVYSVKWYLNAKLVLPLMMLTCIGLAAFLFLRNRGKFSAIWMLLSLLMLILAVVFRGLDLAKWGCNPRSWVQLHAFWHLCTGLSGFFFLAFLRSEKA